MRLLDRIIVRSERRCRQAFFVHQVRHVGTAPPKTNGFGFRNLWTLNNNRITIDFSIRRHELSIVASDRKVSQRLVVTTGQPSTDLGKAKPNFFPLNLLFAVNWSRGDKFRLAVSVLQS